MTIAKNLEEFIKAPELYEEIEEYAGSKEEIIEVLSLACVNGKIEIVKTLINNNVDINRYCGVSHLDLAIVNEQEEVVKLLLEEKANVNNIVYGDINKLFLGATKTLHIAIKTKNLNIVELLLAHKADPIVDDCNFTPLSRAANCGTKEIFDKLIEFGARTSYPDILFADSTIFPIGDDNCEILQYILKSNKVDLDITDKNGLTPLHHIVRNNKYNRAKLLLENKANVNAKDKNNTTIISIAIDADNIEMVKLLLEHNADLKIKNEDGLDPVTQAFENGQHKIYELLKNINNKTESQEPQNNQLISDEDEPGNVSNDEEDIDLIGCSVQ